MALHLCCECKKVLLWGLGRYYDSLLNIIKYEILKGSMSVVAVVCRDEDRYCKKKDGFNIITRKEIGDYEFDYVVITSNVFYNEIKKEALESGIKANKIINGGVFEQTLFDFSRYISLIENPITILSDDCWGGYVYHRLGLPFSSPLINIYWDRDEYARFIEKPLFYLDTDLKIETDGDISRGIYPVGKIGTETDYVKMKFVHNIDFAEAREQWIRRKDRINPENLFVKMGFSASVGDENVKRYVDAFCSVPYKKVLFYNGYFDNTQIKGQFITDRFIWKQKSGSRVQNFDYNDYLRSAYPWDLDLLKMLNGEESFSRYE